MMQQPEFRRVEVVIPPDVRVIHFPMVSSGGEECTVPVDSKEPTFHRCDVHHLMIVPTKVKG